MADAPSAFYVERVMSVWMAARAQLAADPDLAGDENGAERILAGADADVREILARLLRAALHADAMATAADTMAATLIERTKRYQGRRDALRDTAAQIMEIIGEKRVELPDLTASLATSQPSVVITDEAALPDEYWRVTRSPDKRAIGEDLKQGVVIDGATLGNPKSSLRIRVR